MERRNTERADNILQKFLHDSGLGTPYLQYKLVQAWPTVVDETVATATHSCPAHTTFYDARTIGATAQCCSGKHHHL